jgi:hypothetical protein
MARKSMYGSLQRTDGSGAPVQVLSPSTLDKGGFEPEALDPLIAKVARNAMAESVLLDRYTPMLETIMKQLETQLAGVLRQLAPNPTAEAAGEPNVRGVYYEALNLAEKVSLILERLNRMKMNAIRALDDGTRLRAYLATGDVDDGGLSGLGEQELRKIINEAAAGWQKPVEE